MPKRTIGNTMIPKIISREHVLEAVRRINRDGIPSKRGSRGYCLVTEGKHLPPKYTIALAHLAATGRLLSSDRFNGGTEANGFLQRLGFRIVECNCGGSRRESGGTLKAAPANRRRHAIAAKQHSERCRECKHRVREMLERIYGACRANFALDWPTYPDAYEGTSIRCTLERVAAALESFQGFGIADFVRRKSLAPCDFWVPNPGFIVEFDESQHFTSPRKLALKVYANRQPLGFSGRRWMELCEQHDAKDNTPPYRDEQRAWYDALRDLVPLTRNLRPTVRLKASDLEWCSLDPDNRGDRERFSSLIGVPRAAAVRSGAAICPAAVKPQPTSTLRVAMVFPTTDQASSNGVPPGGIRARQPVLPTSDAFVREAVDFVLFPEGYIDASDRRSCASLNKLAFELRAPLLVGAIDKDVDTGRNWQVLLRFDPDGVRPSRLYVKHSTAEAVAFERPDWVPREMLPTFELSGVRAGATICHDAYLGLLPRYLAAAGARIWINPSFDNVSDIKWSSVLRLRAVENRVFALCTLHCDPKRRKTHPFGFSPDGNELLARKAGSGTARPLSECVDPGVVYVMDLDIGAAGEPVEWWKIPRAERSRPVAPLAQPVRVCLNDGQPAVFGRSGWEPVGNGCRIETSNGPVYAEVVPEKRILDAGACFRVIDRAKQMNASPIIWNHWKRLPTDSDRLAMLMMGRAIECCAPITISDKHSIRELVELANRNKIPTRRDMEPSGVAVLDLRYAWGLNNAFKMVAKRLRGDMQTTALDHYRSLR